MSSSDVIKKRKVEGNNVEGGEVDNTASMSAAVEESGTTLSAILAEMKDYLEWMSWRVNQL